MIKDVHAIAQIKKSGRMLGEVVQELMAMAKPGVTTRELDALAEKRILELGGRPAFKGYNPNWSGGGFPGTICASVNEQVVHGIPSDYVLKEGDLLGVDIGMEWPAKDGLYTDTAVTIAVGEISQEHKQLLKRTQEAMYRGLRAARPGNTIADIGRAVEDYITPFGYGIVTALVGHGVGYAVHEEPQVPNVYKKSNESIAITPGMVLAIEPMITLGTADVETAEDGWSIVSADNSMTAHFEHTIIVEEDGVYVATQRPKEDPKV